jgi:DNA-binding transcriptional regulator YiaG
MVNRTESASGEGGRVLPEFLDKLMGIRLLLINSAFEATQDGETAPIVPDVIGLEAAAAVARVTIAAKLSGKEIRILRKALGVRAAALAEFLDVTPETFSRWENGKETISNNAERILRLRVAHGLRGKAPGVKAASDAILDLKISPFRMSTSPITLKFERVEVVQDGDFQKVWRYLGVAEEEAEPLKANVA